jgi:hypothetical protein
MDRGSCWEMASARSTSHAHVTLWLGASTVITRVDLNARVPKEKNRS